MRRHISAVSRSLTAKALTIALFFLGVPLILYSRFHAADSEKRDFLIRSLQSQGRLVAETLGPKLETLSGNGLLNVEPLTASVAGEGLRVKILLRPQTQSGSFLLMATNPPLRPEQRQAERASLAQMGIMDRLDQSCADSRPLAVGYKGAEGDDEFLTSIAAIHNPAGCWVIVTSYAGTFSLTRPFWAAPEVRLAVALYVMIVILLTLAIVGAALDLRAFTRLAGLIRHRDGRRGSFASVAQIPELAPVAREFDRMVGTLDASAQTLRNAAADNAHALKTPIATITQSLEQLRPAVSGNSRCERALDVIDRSLNRLAALVENARRLDEDTAELMQSGLQPIDLAALCRDMAAAYDKACAPRVRFSAQTGQPAWVRATTDSLETILENLLDNAADFSPDGGTVMITAAVSGPVATVSVTDQGPGVPPDRLTQIFKRDYSSRPDARDAPHYGIGLAIVRNTVEILGGTVAAANRDDGGLIVTITLPFVGHG